jgi:hypothetical protein
LLNNFYKIKTPVEKIDGGLLERGELEGDLHHFSDYQGIDHHAQLF